MSRNIEEPVTVASSGPIGDTTVTTHPAYAQIGASRVSGHTALYDSDFNHQNYMTISIRRSELHRSLSRDWHFGREEYIEVALSESQWATFVSSPNMGSGVPCTLQHFDGKRVAGLPTPPKPEKLFDKEVRKEMEECLAKIDATIAEIGDLGLSKVKQERVTSSLRSVRGYLNTGIPFVASQFSEHMENTVERAKQEVHGYVLSTIQRAGLQAIADASPPIQFRIEDESAK